MMTQPAGEADLVTVCTANVARSPLLHVRLQWEADRRLGAGAVRVASVGTDALYGIAAAGGSNAIAKRWELPLDGHRSRPLPYVDLPAAALIVPMTRAHERAIGRHAPDAAAQTIRLRELVKLIERHGDELAAGLPAPDPATPRVRIEAAVAAITAHRRLRPWRQLDLPDPVGSGQAAYDALGAEIEAAAAVIAELMFGHPC